MSRYAAFRVAPATSNFGLFGWYARYIMRTMRPTRMIMIQKIAQRMAMHHVKGLVLRGGGIL